MHIVSFNRLKERPRRVITKPSLLYRGRNTERSICVVFPPRLISQGCPPVVFLGCLPSTQSANSSFEFPTISNKPSFLPSAYRSYIWRPDKFLSTLSSFFCPAMYAILQYSKKSSAVIEGTIALW